MSKKHLTHADLKIKGLKLNKYEAQDLHSHISRIAQHGSDDPEEIYPGEYDEEDEAIASGPTDENTPDDDEDDLTEEQLQENDHKVLARYEKRKEQLIALGADYSEQEAIFTAGDQIISDEEVMAGDESDFEGIVEQVQMALQAYRDQNQKSDNVSDSDDNSGNKKLKFQLPPNEKEHHKTKSKRLADSKMIEHIVTQEDLDNNAPDLENAGVKVGDTIEIPADE